MYAQPAAKAVEAGQATLNERFELMKDGSQTYESYKVIKANILDQFWKMTMDSLIKEKQNFAAARAEITAMQSKVKSTLDSLQTERASIQDVVFDSEHINVIGIPFGKSIFLILVAAIVGGLIFFSVGLVTRMKMLNSLVKEKTLIADSITNEFEDFKKRAMEKQTKLSRELQNERNKLQELRRV